LGVEVPEAVWPSLVEAAQFEQMRDNSNAVVPNAGGVLKDPSAFFRRGRSGAGAETLSPDEMSVYVRRATELAPPDMLRWLHRNHAAA